MASIKPTKTLAMRILDGYNVSYEPVYYEVIDHLSAAEVAAAIGMPPEQTFKTLVALPDRVGARPILALAPGDSLLDLKKLATTAGEKKVQMAPQREAERLTGLEKGGISPLALLDRGWPIIIDETIILFDRIEISAGKVGVGVIVEVEGLLRVLRARQADIIS
ncbi:MAG: Cys-tRNA(Pro) deacylase [Anaerolineae bacterium]|jgi:Cys-tRNA(Pro)/Cys-tRNA(Cys) deacylase|nr:Cys-tRNA(Pro) deacylase [Anaerolineae bacterium]